MKKIFSSSSRKRGVVLRKTATSRQSAQSRNGAWKSLRLDKRLVFITMVFVITGLLFTYSSSAFSSSAFFKRQLLFDILGLVIAAVLAQVYNRIQQAKWCKPIYLMYITWGLLIWVLFTRTQANVHRWIDFGFFKLQPSEIAKVTLVIYIAHYLESVAGRLERNWKLLLKPLVIAGFTLVLILAEKDFGTPFLMGIVFACMMLVAGMRKIHLGALALLMSPFAYHQLFGVAYRRERILSFLNPFAAPGGIGYQLVQSFLAVGSGGWFGKGLGNSELKLEYLPAAHTDFIFSVMCEEFGLIRIALILGGFCWLLVRGISLAGVAKTHFRSLVIFGLTITISLQAFFNMAMAIGLIPTKGIALPFFSYGGSSVVMTLVMMGIILNLAAVDSVQNDSRDDVTSFRNRNK